MEEIILVDESDAEIGYSEKLAAHQDGGQLHRAFSIFIYNSRGQMLLQRRAAAKYHFGGLWTNACCSHPRRGEVLEQAVHERLQFEMGFDTPLNEVSSFIYKATDPASGLTEHEFDHIFVGHYDADPQPNPDEVDDWKRIDVADLRGQFAAQPQIFTPWFKIAFKKLGADAAAD